MDFAREMVDTLGTARDSWLNALGLGQSKPRQNNPADMLQGGANYDWLFNPADVLAGKPGINFAEATSFMPFAKQMSPQDLITSILGGAAVKPGKPRTTLDAVGPKVDSGMGKVTTPTVPAPAAPAPVSGGGGTGVLRWKPLAAESAAKWGVPQDVILGLVDIESGGNPEAVSKAGAKGLGQIMDFHWTPEQLAAGAPYDPAANIDKVGELMARGIERYGDIEKAAAAYFGALGKDANGNWVITDASDGAVKGTEYVRKFNEARSKYFAPEEE